MRVAVAQPPAVPYDVTANAATHAAIVRSAGRRRRPRIHRTLASALNEPDEPRDERMRDRALAHRIPVIAACGAGPDGPMSTCGGSGFWRPDGTIAAQAGTEPGEVLVADLSDDGRFTTLARLRVAGGAPAVAG